MLPRKKSFMLENPNDTPQQRGAFVSAGFHMCFFSSQRRSHFAQLYYSYTETPKMKSGRLERQSDITVMYMIVTLQPQHK